ncbi:MAG TPA: MaoC family dehydratase [Streptosporangiaceae bacterium]|jgi:acyl dehydratase
MLPSEQVHVGSSLEVMVRGPVGRVQIAKFAAGTRDFNPLHLDDEFARTAGFPTAVAHGPLTLAFFMQALSANFGPLSVRGVAANFKAPVFPGDVLEIGGTVDEIEEKDGVRYATATLFARRGDTTVATGSGRAVLSPGGTP